MDAQGSRRTASSADTKEVIIATTVELLREIDLHELRVNEVCRRAHVSTPTLYYYFESLGTLLVEAVIVSLERFLVPFDTSLRDMNSARTKDQYIDALQLFLNESWSLVTAEKAHRLAPLMSHIRMVAPRDIRMRELQSNGIAQLASAQVRGQANQWLRDDIDLATFVVIHWTCVLGQAVFWHPSFGPLTGLVESADGWHLRFQTALSDELRNLPVR